MNNVCEVVVTAITPNGSAALPFVIPRACDFFDRFVFSARLPDDFSTPSKPVILRACDFFDLSCFSDNEPDVS
jgi:hypothetical protein